MIDHDPAAGFWKIALNAERFACAAIEPAGERLLTVEIVLAERLSIGAAHPAGQAAAAGKRQVERDFGCVGCWVDRGEQIAVAGGDQVGLSTEEDGVGDGFWAVDLVGTDAAGEIFIGRGEKCE
jgi:hypothetical protein